MMPCISPKAAIFTILSTMTLIIQPLTAAQATKEDIASKVTSAQEVIGTAELKMKFSEFFAKHAHDTPPEPVFGSGWIASETKVIYHNGQAIFDHRLYNGTKSSGTDHASDVRALFGDYNPYLADNYVASTLPFLPFNFNGPSLGEILHAHQEKWNLESDDQALFETETWVISFGDAKLWLDKNNGGMLRRVEFMADDSIILRREVPAIFKSDQVAFPKEIRTTAFHETKTDHNGEPLAYSWRTISIAPNSVRVNFDIDQEMLHGKPLWTAIWN